MNPETQNQPETEVKKDLTPHDRHNHNGAFAIIKRATAWVMIISATLFALVGVLAVWEVFGANAGDVVWRAFASLAIIAFAAFVINVASRIATRQ